MKHKVDFVPITASNITPFLYKNILEIKPRVIVQIKTVSDNFNGVSAEATEWLIDKGIKVIKTNSWGWNLPLPYMLTQDYSGRLT